MAITVSYKVWRTQNTFLGLRTSLKKYPSIFLSEGMLGRIDRVYGLNSGVECGGIDPTMEIMTIGSTK